MIAFLGQGRMGAPMARRLVAAGHKVTTWRRGTGVPAATAVAGADLVITMLSDPAAVREVLTAALPGLRPGATVVEMSTIGPEAVHELRALLPAEVGLVDAPVLGGVGPAADGTLTVLAGGDLSGCREVLSVFGSVRELGPLGSGAAMKIAVMSAMVPAQVLLAETYAYGRAHGVDREALIDVLSGTPLGVLAERLRVPSEETRYSLAHAVKDLELGAWDGGSLATAARTRLQEARAAGYGGRDLTSVVEHVEGGQVIARILADQGATFGDIAFIRTYLTDMDARAEYGAVRRKYITGTPPASTTVEVSKLFMPGLLLEVDLIVALSPGGR
ncbi:3-hydroxyisobutyrate dehydrogenase [Nonomuraea turkmeniaca]|uniref:3-hydroxyisobutyrate dehydrogenase n=1 Tax=Nonomuraea turkmeniaca TaxID=103838 RepID=A0A5S4EYP5_9ACTN|nr:NAD(P)-binding domain-containing protein [Nonomuraea turkmeniaca]TMR08820.1 3-hydroxyisobutyrate dehydrogenase [Nonomuraea turkmeniaca]